MNELRSKKKNKWHLICIYRQIVNQLQKFALLYLLSSCESFGGQSGFGVYAICIRRVRRLAIHQPTRSFDCCCCLRWRSSCCCALYSNDGNNRKNANIICHFLFQHATYHHPSAVKCYILKYKFNSYSLSSVTSASRIILLFLSCRVLFAFRHSASLFWGTHSRSIFYCR